MLDKKDACGACNETACRFLMKIFAGHTMMTPVLADQTQVEQRTQYQTAQ